MNKVQWLQKTKIPKPEKNTPTENKTTQNGKGQEQRHQQQYNDNAVTGESPSC